MSLDLRIPMGLMFALVGMILTAYGLATRGSAIYNASLGINANFWWGLVLLVFGVSMLLLGRRSQKRLASMPPEPVGLAALDDLYGVLGIDFLDQLKAYTFDYRTMRFGVRTD